MNEEQKVWLVVSEWSNGRRFEHDTYIQVRGSYESAHAEFEYIKEEAFECFRNVYNEDDVILDEANDGAEIYTENYEDFWEGYIYETKVIN